ncbi:MAG: LUD domain-containing protein [Candidatus Acidiferrales bacterium]
MTLDRKFNSNLIPPRLGNGEARTAELLSTFEAAAIAAAATVERCSRTPKALRAALEHVIAPGDAVVLAAPTSLPTDLLSQFQESRHVNANPSSNDLASANAGISEAFAAVARTGSICVSLGDGLAGQASLLPTLHIALLPAEKIVERPRDLFRQDCLDGDGLRLDFVFITGPSATADMGPLVRGVHGPHRLHIIILE